jgi:plastocyanin
MRRLAHVFGILAVLALVATSCASGKATGLPAGPTEEPSTEACDGTIDMTQSLKFVPEECTITVGTTVTWTIVGGVPHTATSEPDAPVKFDSGQLSAGSYEFTFDKVGTVPYYCKLHASPGARSGMIGTIIVEAASS